MGRIGAINEPQDGEFFQKVLMGCRSGDKSVSADCVERSLCGREQRRERAQHISSHLQSVDLDQQHDQPCRPTIVSQHIQKHGGGGVKPLPPWVYRHCFWDISECRKDVLPGVPGHSEPTCFLGCAANRKHCHGTGEPRYHNASSRSFVSLISGIHSVHGLWHAAPNMIQSASFFNDALPKTKLGLRSRWFGSSTGWWGGDVTHQEWNTQELICWYMFVINPSKI